MISERSAWGFGLATITDDGVTLDTWYPEPALVSLRSGGCLRPAELEALVGKDEVRRVRRELVQVGIDLDAPPADASDAYLRLHLLSHTRGRPNTINLDGIFGALPTWCGRRRGRVRSTASR